MTRPAVIVLSAGLGTRLAPLTDELPKPLFWLGDRPVLDGILATLARLGFERAVVNTHHLASALDERWVEAQPLEVVLRHEREILGTGGALVNAASALGEGDVFVWNGDIVAEPDLTSLLRAHDGFAARGAVATLVTGPLRPTGEGTLGLDADGAVVRLRAFRRGDEVASADYAGMSVVRPRLRAALAMPGCLFGEGLVPALERGDTAMAVPLLPVFRDIGTPEGYLDANLAWLDARGLESVVAPDALVAPAVRLSRAVVARGARVEGAGELREVVVWPGATAHAPLARAVVTPKRVLSLSR